jgi:hypothetical protein
MRVALYAARFFCGGLKDYAERVTGCKWGATTRTFVDPIHGVSYSSVFSQLSKEYAIHGFCEKIGGLACSTPLASSHTHRIIFRLRGLRSWDVVWEGLWFKGF